MAVGKEMMERKIINQDQHQGRSLGQNGGNVQKVGGANFDQVGQKCANDGCHMKAQAALEPGTFRARQMCKRKAVIGDKIRHNRDFRGADISKCIVDKYIGRPGNDVEAYEENDQIDYCRRATKEDVADETLNQACASICSQIKHVQQ